MVKERTLSFNDVSEVIKKLRISIAVDSFHLCEGVKYYNDSLHNLSRMNSSCILLDVIPMLECLRNSILDCACNRYFEDITTEDIQRMEFDDILDDCLETQIPLREIKAFHQAV